MIAPKSIQIFLQQDSCYKGEIDGIFGPKAKNAVSCALSEHKIDHSGWDYDRKFIALQQLMMHIAGVSDVGLIDGLMGPMFQAAFEHYQDFQRYAPCWVDDSQLSKRWPLQSDVEKIFGKPGENLVKITLPRPMTVAWDKKQIVTSVLLHKLVADSAQTALEAECVAYSLDRWKQLGLHLHGGTFNIRKMKGNSSKLSMHSWGIAWDRDPENNAYRMHHGQASFARPEYEAFCSAWEAQGWVSLGRTRDIDWMHWQAARLG